MKFVVLEYDVLDCEELTNTEKLLYGYIVALSQNNKGCCFASNDVLCQMMNLSKSQLKRCLSTLKKYNFISSIIIKNKRYITPTINKFLEMRYKNNKNKDLTDLFDYNWLDEEE